MEQRYQSVLTLLSQELKKQDKPENLMNAQQFHKGKLRNPMRLRTSILRKISNQTFKTVRQNPEIVIPDCCDYLLESKKQYMLFFAFDWAGKISKQYQPGDFKRFERWLKIYVDNWGACDHLGCVIFGPLIASYPELATKLKPWTKSKNRWLRRAAAVSLIIPVRRKMLLSEVFEMADILFDDPDDLVQKGYGWMLKEASNSYLNEVFAYVMRHKDSMPRTAFRYAIEKMSVDKRKKAMAKTK